MQNNLNIRYSLVSILICCITLACGSKDDDDSNPSPSANATFHVEKNYLIDPCGDKIVLKGVNKMSVFDEGDPFGDQYFPEIAKTNANSVRIVWQTVYNNGSAAPLTQLEKLIQNCMQQKMIPLVEVHDATCDLGQLSKVVDYWTRADVVALVQKYEHALLVNIANEAGDYAVTSEQFLAAYKTAITRMRNAGIRTPLLIDAPDCGKNLDVMAPTTKELMAHDPAHNLIFSFHAYWSKAAIAFAQPTFIKDELQMAADLELPFIIGELAAYGGWPGDGQPDYASCTEKGSIDYITLLKEAASHDMGYFVWEWGPGNGYYNYDPPKLCPELDITTDGTYQSILAIPIGNATRGWIRDVVVDNSLSIKKTSVKTSYLTNDFACK